MALRSEHFEVRRSRVKALLSVVGCLGFVAGGLWLKDLPGDRAQIAGWLSILFFGAVAPGWLAEVIWPSILTADEYGITIRYLVRTRHWSWSEIAQIVVQRYRSSDFIHLQLNEPVGNGRLRALPSMFGPRKIGLPTAWSLPPQEIARRLTEVKARWGDQAPSRPPERIIM